MVRVGWVPLTYGILAILPDRSLWMRGSVLRSSRVHALVRALAPGALALVIAGVTGGAATLAVHRQDKPTTHRAPTSRAAPTGSGTPTRAGPPGPTEPGLATIPPGSVVATGRGRGLARLIPCYTVTSAELSRVLGAPMALTGQRAAGENGGGLSGVQREDCFWFSTQPDGPYVVLSDVTTSQLQGRHGMSGWTARRYFDDVPPAARTYLPGVGDAAYAYGPASVAVLVGDVYLDVTVVTDDGHPLRDAVAIAKLMAKLRSTLSR
jgi:hypothetical protein